MVAFTIAWNRLWGVLCVRPHGELSGSLHAHKWHVCRSAAQAPAHEGEDGVRLRWTGVCYLGPLR